MTQWEYRVRGPMSEEEMNLFGGHGWELAAVYPALGKKPPALVWKRRLDHRGLPA